MRRILYADNASCQPALISREFVVKTNMPVLPSPPHSPCSVLLFFLKLQARRFRTNAKIWRNLYTDRLLSRIKRKDFSACKNLESNIFLFRKPRVQSFRSLYSCLRHEHAVPKSHEYWIPQDVIQAYRRSFISKWTKHFFKLYPILFLNVIANYVYQNYSMQEILAFIVTKLHRTDYNGVNDSNILSMKEKN